MRWIVYFRTIGHILPGPIHWCKICLKVPPWDTDSLRTNDRNLCQRVVVVRWSLQKLSQSMQFSTCWRENLCIFLFVTVCCFPYKCLHVTICSTILYSIILKFDKDPVQSWDYSVPHMMYMLGMPPQAAWWPVDMLKAWGFDPARTWTWKWGAKTWPCVAGLHLLQNIWRTYAYMLKNVLWHLLEIYTTCSYFAL